MPKQTQAVFCRKIKGTLPHLCPGGKTLRNSSKVQPKQKNKTKQSNQKTIKAVIQPSQPSSWILKDHYGQIKTLQLCPKPSSMCCGLLPRCSAPPLTSASPWRRPLSARYVFWHVAPWATTDKWFPWLTCSAFSQREDFVRGVELPAWFTASSWESGEWSEGGRDQQMLWSNAAYQIMSFLSWHVITQLAWTDKRISTGCMRLKWCMWRNRWSAKIFNIFDIL